MPNLFIFGFGYTAKALATLAKAQGYTVCGTSRSAEKRQELQALSYEAVDFCAQDMLPMLENATHIVVSSPLNKTWEDPVLTDFGSIIDRISTKNPWIGYLSTTGVYGDHEGAWIDERTPPNPWNDRASGRLRAEKEWLALGGNVFRLAGIYGPGRNTLRQLKDGTARPIFKEGQVFSRIHVDDIARILMASMKRSRDGKIYNVCDDLPAASHEVIAYGAQLLGMAAPSVIPIEQADLSDMAKEFYQANRRVRNEKMKKELGITLLHPTYREGLSTLLKNGNY
jgi:nucleoside-diphosphate-sugar epimerase